MKKKQIYLAGIILCALLFGISIFQIISHTMQSSRSEQEFQELAKIVELSEEGTGEAAVKESEEETEKAEDTLSPLERYQELFHENNDLAGWVRIEGTDINYPVMYTPDNPDFYLRHNFYKESSSHGVPYIAEHCSPELPSDNLIIYGHHMNDGSMFADLMKYENKDFYESHPTIHFDTLTETAEYQIVTVFKTTVYDDTGFRYYLFADAASQEEFDSYIQSCRELALYDTGVTASYGEKLITLSTCEYSQKNGRMVIVAKKIMEP